MNYCANCAAPLPQSADFCPKCGKSLRVAVAPPTAPGAPVAATPAATMTTTDPTKPVKRRAPWWIVPLVIVGLVVIAFVVLLGLPFGGREGNRPVSTAAKVETIAEADPVPPRGPGQTGTVVDLDADTDPDTDVGGELPPTVVATQPPLVTTQAPPPARTQPAPVRTQPAPARTQPTPVRTEPAPVRTQPPARMQPPPARTEPAPAQGEEISVSEAMGTLRSFITSRDYYGSGADCIGVGSLGYQNTGYTLEVRNTCSSRTLGRWRVDAKTREIFRQQPDGRYLRP